MYVYTYTVLETRMSGYYLLFVFPSRYWQWRVAKVVVVQPLGTYVFGSVKYQYLTYLIPEVVRLRGTVRKPESMDYIHGAKHDSVSCYGRYQ